MKYFSSFALFFLLLSTKTFAQSNFKPGYIVGLKSDTVKGLVDAREWDLNPDMVVFKPNAEGQAVTYTVNDIKGFGVFKNADFEKMELPISVDYIDIGKASVHARQKTEVRTVFLKVVTTGNVLNLYSYTDLIKTRFVVLEKANNHVQELVYHVYTDENVSFVKWISQYKDQLLYLADSAKVNNPSLKAKIESSRYDQIEIGNIVLAINKDNGPVFTAEKLFKTRFFIGASYVNSSFNYEISEPFTKGLLHSSGPKIGAGIDLIFNKKKGDAFFRVEVGYNQDKFNFLIQDNSFVSRNFFINYKTISLQPQFIYNLYAKDNLKFFLDVGFILNSYKFDNYSIYTNGTNPPEVQHPETLKLSNSTTRLLLKAGLVVSSHFEFNLGYITKSEIPGGGNARFDISGYQAGFNYLF